MHVFLVNLYLLTLPGCIKIAISAKSQILKSVHRNLRRFILLCRLLRLCGKVHGNAFSRVKQKYTKLANFYTLLYFRHFTIFYNQTSQCH